MEKKIFFPFFFSFQNWIFKIYLNLERLEKKIFFVFHPNFLLYFPYFFGGLKTADLKCIFPFGEKSGKFLLMHFFPIFHLFPNFFFDSGCHQHNHQRNFQDYDDCHLFLKHTTLTLTTYEPVLTINFTASHTNTNNHQYQQPAPPLAC